MLRLLRTLYGYSVFALVLLTWLPTMAVLRVVTAPFDPTRRVVGRFFRLLAVACVKSVPSVKATVEHVERRQKGRPYVVVANHESHLDILLLSHLPWEMKWLCKRSLFGRPVVGWLLRLAGDIPVERGDRDSGRAALEMARSYLERGMSVMIFPEGTRTRDGQMLPFKEGAFRLAIQTGCPILPVVVMGAADGMPAQTRFLDPCSLRAVVLDPVEVTGLTEADVPRLTAAVRQLILDARHGRPASLPPLRAGTPALEPVPGSPLQQPRAGEMAC